MCVCACVLKAFKDMLPGCWRGLKQLLWPTVRGKPLLQRQEEQPQRPHVKAKLLYLHSHWLCSSNGSSTSSCFMKEVLISCAHNNASQHQPPFRSADGWDGASRYLHGERVRERGNTLQGFIGAAAAASSQRHAGRDEEVVRLPR